MKALLESLAKDLGMESDEQSKNFETKKKHKKHKRSKRSNSEKKSKVKFVHVDTPVNFPKVTSKLDFII